MTPRRGAILLEAMIALAIFVMAALAVLAIVDRAMRTAREVRDTERASFLARSAMARIEAGVVLPQAISGPVSAESDRDDALSPGAQGWELEISTEPSSMRGLTLVRVTALRRSGGIQGRVLASCTLSQFVRLSPGSLALGDRS